MSARLYVLGHRNPDTDAIGATIGYATLLRLQHPSDEVVDGRLGALRPETIYLLERFSSYSNEPVEVALQTSRSRE